MMTKAYHVRSYPIGQAATQYREEVKPVLAEVAKRLGYTVGPYSGNGLPSTVLRAKDATSPIATVVLYYHGVRLEAGIRSRAHYEQMKTVRGQMAHAMSFGVHEAYGDSVAPDLATRIEEAIKAATRTFQKGGL